jgi:hypothetical protein
MNKCYDLKQIHYEKGLFDKFIDMSYVITTTTSKRHATFLHQLNKFKPTKTITIVYNNTYKAKDCDKKICGKKVDKTSEDLMVTNKFIFENAKKNNYNNILILEDDVEFSNKLLDNPEVIDDIEEFITENKFNTYSLGGIMFAGEIFGKHRKVFAKGGTHAMIYSKDYRRYFNDCDENDIDVYTNMPHNINGYRYKDILAGQLHLRTENVSNWGKIASLIFFPILEYNTTKYGAVEGYEQISKKMANFIVLLLFIIIISLLIICLFRI